MGHGWASDVALSDIHERYLFTSPLHFIYEHSSKYGFTVRMHLSPNSELGYLSFKGTRSEYDMKIHFCENIRFSKDNDFYDPQWKEIICTSHYVICRLK